MRPVQENRPARARASTFRGLVEVKSDAKTPRRHFESPRRCVALDVTLGPGCPGARCVALDVTLGPGCFSKALSKYAWDSSWDSCPVPFPALFVGAGGDSGTRVPIWPTARLLHANANGARKSCRGAPFCDSRPRLASAHGGIRRGTTVVLPTPPHRFAMLDVTLGRGC